MDSTVSKPLDYQKVTKSHPYYRFNKILPINGLQETKLTVAGGNELQFEIPVCAFNLAKSYLNFQMTIPDNGNPNYNWVYADVAGPIRQMQLYTRNSIYLADLYNVNSMTKILTKINTKLDDFLTFDDAEPSDGNGTAVPGTQSILRRNKYALSSLLNYTGFGSDEDGKNPVGGAGIVVSADIKTPTLKVLLYPLRPDKSSYSQSFTEPLYLDKSALGDGAGQGILNYNFSIPLSQFSESIFSLDKVLYMNEILVLRIVFDSLSKVSFYGTSPQDPTAGAAANATDVDLKNIQLFLAVEQDPLIIQGLRQQVASGGFSTLIPYIYCYKTALNGSTHTISLRFNRGHGRRLQKVYTSSFTSTETLNNAYNCSNLAVATGLNGNIVSSFYSMLNNQRIQEINMNCAKYDDWNFLQQKLQGCVIQNSNIYGFNWFWVDDFTELEKLYHSNPNDDIGIPLDVEQKYDLYLTMNGTLNRNNYTFAVCQKMLTVSAAGITVI